MTDVPFIEIEDVHFSRGSHEIFRGISMIIPQGNVTAIMGPSGTGKTTLLKLIGGQLTPDRGRIIVDGQDVHRLSSPEEAMFALRKRMGCCWTRALCFRNLDVFENVAPPLRVHTDLPDAMIQDSGIAKASSGGAARGLVI